MIRINLLPVRAEKRKENLRKHALMLGGYVLILIAVAFSVNATLGTRVDEKRALIARQKQQIQRLDEEIKKVEGYKQTIAELTEKIEIVRGLEVKQRGPAQIFVELSMITPEKVWLEKMTQSGGTMHLEGYAINRQVVADFMTNLEKSTFFRNVRLIVSEQRKKSDAELQAFTLETTVVPPKLETAVADGKEG